MTRMRGRDAEAVSVTCSLSAYDSEAVSVTRSRGVARQIKGVKASAEIRPRYVQAYAEIRPRYVKA